MMSSTVLVGQRALFDALEHSISELIAQLLADLTQTLSDWPDERLKLHPNHVSLDTSELVAQRL